MSEKSRLVTLFFCIWFGMFGGHRFYVGKTGTGVVWLLTFGCFFIGFIEIGSTRLNSSHT